VRPRCAARTEFGGYAREERLVRWAQAATERIPAAQQRFWEKSLPSHLQVAKLAR